MKIKLFITGGTGSFGRTLLRYWESQYLSGAEVPSVTVLSRYPEKFIKRFPEFHGREWLCFHSGDILDPETFPGDKGFTHVIHAAADSTLESQLEPLNRYDQIVNGTRNMLDYSIASDVKRFLYVSSGGGYGKQSVDLEEIPESYCGAPDVLIPDNAYGVAKRTAEHLCTLYRAKYGVEIVVARCFTFVGRDFPLNAHFAIGNFIRDALWKDEIIVAGDGSSVRSYLDQYDLAEWLIVLLKRGKAGSAYNVGSDKAITVADLAYLVRDLISPDKSVNILGKQMAKGAGRRYVPDITRAKVELGLEVKISLADAIRTTAKFAKW